MLKEAEVLLLEAFSTLTRVVTTNLGEDIAAASRRHPEISFSDVIADNVAAGHGYEYVVELHNTGEANTILKEVEARTRLAAHVVDERLSFVAVNETLGAGFVQYAIAPAAAFAAAHPSLFERVHKYAVPESSGFAVTITEPVGLDRTYQLVAPEVATRLAHRFDDLKQRSEPLDRSGAARSGARVRSTR
jgi:hypothetical protein